MILYPKPPLSHPECLLPLSRARAGCAPASTVPGSPLAASGHPKPQGRAWQGSQHSPHARVQHGPGHGEQSAGWAPGRFFQLLVPLWNFLPVEEPAKESSDVGQDGEAHGVNPHPPSAP